MLPKYGINIESGIAPDGITNAANYNLAAIDEAIEELQQGGGGSHGAAGRTMHVDGTRQDAYVEDGTIQRPFKTIMGAVNQIVADGDNSLSKPYDIVIVCPCNFAETIDLSNPALVSVNIVAYDGTTITPPSGHALQCLNNNGFAKANIRNLTFAQPVLLSNGTPNGAMGSQIIDFQECNFQVGFYAANVVFLGFTDCDFGQNTTTQLLNVAQAYCYFGNTGHNGSTFTLTTDTSQPVPSGFSGTYFLGQGSPLNFSTVNVGGPSAGSQLDLDIGSIVGRTGGTLNISNGALVRVFHSATISSDITVTSGGELRMMGGSLRGAVTVQSGGIYSQEALSASASVRAATHEIGGAASGNPTVTSGAGVPEGVVTANIGSLYLRTDGSPGATLYVKEAGTGTNTGWSSAA